MTPRHASFLPLLLPGLLVQGCASDGLASAGASQVIDIVGDGTFNPNVAPEALPDAVATAIPGRWASTFVAETVLGWTAAEIEADKAEGRAFLSERYGLDVEDPAYEGRLTTVDTTLDPRTGFRVVQSTLFDVPEGGLSSWNLATLVVATDPAGVPLGGDFEGEVLGAGQAVLFGAYVFPTDDGVYRVAYRSLLPAVIQDGALVWTCEVESEDFGAGVAQGLAILTPTAEGEVAADIRNHVTFWAP
ncbi:MAG: hypothetical protein RLZZ383_67 [Pseudomonadota bacterium]|jgi:hypothetical protein